MTLTKSENANPIKKLAPGVRGLPLNCVTPLYNPKRAIITSVPKIDVTAKCPLNIKSRDLNATRQRTVKKVEKIRKTGILLITV
jgi:hypothetical protein